MSKLLAVPKIEAPARVALTNEAALAKIALLQTANGITKVEDEQSRDLAIQSSSKIRAHMDLIEKTRKEVKSPFWEMSVAIDTLAREHVRDLDIALKRLNRMAGNFEEGRRATIAAEEARLKREAEKLSAPLSAKVAANPAAALSAQLDAEEKLQEVGDKLQAVQAVKETTKPTGGAIRRDWDITVTDIKALYLAHPQCVELTAKMLSIKDLLKSGITPPGVTATPKTSYNVRAAAR